MTTLIARNGCWLSSSSTVAAAMAVLNRNSVVINWCLYSYAVKVINNNELITGLCCVVCFGLSRRNVLLANG